jgi:hypothetical protein
MVVMKRFDEGRSAYSRLLEPQGGRAGGVVALLPLLGIAVAFTPEGVPGCTVPGASEAVQAMAIEGLT